MLAEALGDVYCPREQLLLVLAEDLLGGKIVSRGAELADASRHHDDVLLLRVDPLQRPLQVVERVVVANRDEHISGANTETAAVDGVPLEQRKVLLQMLLRQRGLMTIGTLGNGEAPEECGGESD